MSSYKLILVFISVLFLSACAGLMKQSQQESSSSLVDYLYPNGQQVDHSSDNIPHLKLPLNVGVAFVPESNDGSTSFLTQAKRQQLLEKVTQQFSDRPYISNIEIIPDIYLKQQSGFLGLQQVARLYGVDVMALVSYDQVATRDENWLSLSYLTIVGAYLIPGENTEAQTFVDTAVFDVNTKRLLFRAPGSNIIDKYHAGVGAEKGIRKMKLESLQLATDQMTKNLNVALDKFREEAKQGEKVTVSYRSDYSGGSVGWLFLPILGFVAWARRK